MEEAKTLYLATSADVVVPGKIIVTLSIQKDPEVF